MQYLNQSGLIKKDEIVVMVSNSNNYLESARMSNNTNTIAIIEQSDDKNQWQQLVSIQPQQTIQVEITKRFIRLKDAEEVYIIQNQSNNNLPLNPVNNQSNIDVSALKRDIVEDISNKLGIFVNELTSESKLTMYKESVYENRYLQTEYGEVALQFQRNTQEFAYYSVQSPMQNVLLNSYSVEELNTIKKELHYQLNYPNDLPALLEYFVDKPDVVFKEQQGNVAIFVQDIPFENVIITDNEVIFETIFGTRNIPVYSGTISSSFSYNTSTIWVKLIN